MGRWRQPSQKSSPYITPSGYQHLESELEQLWQRRTETIRALAVAAAEGDRSENAEYIYRKKELRGIDYRIRYLQKRLPKLKVVREVADLSKVFFGAIVTVENEKGEQNTYRIVGSDEIDQGKNYISIDSPLARAMLGKVIDSVVEIELKKQKMVYWIVNISYQDC